MRIYIGRMAQMVSEVYDALRSVNVPEDKARKAAEAMALPEMGKSYDARFDKIEARFDKVDARFDEIDRDFDRLEADVVVLKTDVTLMKWMLGFALAMIAAVLGRLLFIH
ncbi:hypothetical protein RA307_12540 [Xanthobacteraceae bacterium Astr-EGSB]|uniref:hypothetical protein n=1 Tax=Astrobacterium formosum TaxID=3069710 RepID=UPI0027B19896|nr:hypothetical protein [Xanthobacteraceae bacterium Astr-EGSB]